MVRQICGFSDLCLCRRKKTSHVTPLMVPWSTYVSIKCASFWSWQPRHTQREQIMAYLCHLHVININRLGPCVPVSRQSRITQDHFSGFEKIKPGLLSHCQTFLMYSSHMWVHSSNFFLLFLLLIIFLLDIKFTSNILSLTLFPSQFHKE